jgi:hypothetical protein
MNCETATGCWLQHKGVECGRHHIRRAAAEPEARQWAHLLPVIAGFGLEGEAERFYS